MKRSLILILVLVVIAVGVWLVREKMNQPKRSERILVATSMYPLYFFTQEIGGDKLEVVNLTPAGAEPHDYELTSQDLVAIRESELLVVNGMEPWIKKIGSTLGDAAPPMFIVEENTSLDPHIWLSPTRMAVVVDEIAKKLTEVDSENRTIYMSNATRVKQELMNLDEEYKKGLKKCEKKDFVVAHAAFGYLAGDYGLNQIGIAGLSPDEEPSIQRLSEIAGLVASRGIKTIFFETLVSPKLAETVARETGAKTEVLDPLEGMTPERLEQGDNYYSVMAANLVNLRGALVCQ